MIDERLRDNRFNYLDIDNFIIRLCLIAKIVKNNCKRYTLFNFVSKLFVSHLLVFNLLVFNLFVFDLIV